MVRLVFELLHPLMPIAVISLMLLFLRHERKKLEQRWWNNGICARYEEPWIFYKEELGHKVYKCRDQELWISHKIE